jgi:myo-inositol-1(or 4)-monophosphatase
VEKGEPVFACVYDPYRKELFHAEKGKGAFLNHSPIVSSRKEELENAHLATASPAFSVLDPEGIKRCAESIQKVMPHSLSVRMLGSVALQLAYVACGRLDGYWEHGKDYYDWVAGALLIKESGGTVTDISGNPFGWGSTGIIAAGTAAIQRQALAVLTH